jgi:hypothetical protein
MIFFTRHKRLLNVCGALSILLLAGEHQAFAQLEGPEAIREQLAGAFGQRALRATLPVAVG